MDGEHDNSGGRPDRGTWREPAEPSPGIRLILVAVVGVIAGGISLYGATNAEETGSDAFLLFMGAAAIALAVAVREIVQLVHARRRRRRED